MGRSASGEVVISNVEVKDELMLGEEGGEDEVQS